MPAAAVVVAWLWFPGLACARDEAVDRPPNVIVVLMDDLGWADLGCYGSTWHRTPRLDRWAATGTRFTQAYAACPVCSPTRAALLTGKWPARLRITDWIPGRPDGPDQRLRHAEFLQQLPLEEVTLAERLRAAGFATASVGKWHLGGEGFEPTRQGFDLNIAGDRRGVPLDYFSPYRRDGRTMPGLERAPPEEYLTDRLTDEAIAFVERNRERPFFLYLSHFAVHVPLRAPKSLIGNYPAVEAFHGRQNNPVYAAMLEGVDTGFGRLLDRLRDWSLDGRTIIVFTSDNGGQAITEGPNAPPTSNAPLRDGKGFLYEGGIRVPLVIAGPGVRSGHVSAFPTSTIDLVPTLLELCRVADDRSHDGVSLAPTLAGREQVERPPLYWHYPHYANHASRPGGAIRVGDHKLIEFYDTGRRELFDVVTDPGERRNLVEQEPERVRELAGKFDAWRTKVSARMPRPNPDYHPNRQDEQGFVVMPARHADVHGAMLRFEPMPHKNTLGYWVRAEDWAEWQFEITTPGRFDLEVSQGCGEGSGGAEVIWEVGGQSIGMIVQETGGFQDFLPRRIGTITLERPGRYTLTVTPKTKPGPAVMDVRQVRLIPR